MVIYCISGWLTKYKRENCTEWWALWNSLFMSNLCAVILFNVLQDTNVIVLHKVDGHSSLTIPARPTNSGGTGTNHHETQLPLSLHSCFIVRDFPQYRLALGKRYINMTYCSKALFNAMQISQDNMLTFLFVLQKMTACVIVSVS